MAWVTFIKEMRMWTMNTTTNKNFCTTVLQNCISSLTSLGDWFWTLNPPFRPIFIWVSKIFRDYIGFASLRTVIWPKNFAPRSQPIRCKTKTINDLVARVFPRFRQFGCYHSDFPLPLKRYFLFIWLAVEITLVLVLPQSIKYSKTNRMQN